MIYRVVNAFFKSVFYFLNEVRQLHVKEIEQMHGGDADADADADTETDTDTETDQTEPKPDPFVKTNIKSEWTPEKTIKITLDIIIGSDGLAVFMHPFSQPRPPTPPPHPIPDPVDDTPTIDEFHIDVDFGDRAPAAAAAAVENDDVNVVEE